VSLLSGSNVSLTRGSRLLVQDLAFSLEAGGITVVLGPNGAGKSSLLLALAGLLEIDTGEIFLNEQLLSTCSRKDVATLIGWQGEMPPTEFGLTVEERLHLTMHAGLSIVAGERRRTSACGAMDLLPLRQRALGELSSGERQRAELAALLVRDCPVWLLDEPCAHLDIRHQSAWLMAMRAKAEEGKAIITVLHDVQQAAAVANDVILIYGDGRVRAGPASKLLLPDVLCELFQANIQQLDDKVLVPDYRVAERSSA